MTHWPAVKIAALATCGSLLGFVWAAAFAQHYLQQELSKEWEGRDVTVLGTIASLPDRFEQGVRFNFAVEQVFYQKYGRGWHEVDSVLPTPCDFLNVRYEMKI